MYIRYGEGLHRVSDSLVTFALGGWEHRHGEGRIANFAEPASECRSACAEYRGKTLLPGLVRRLWNKTDIARVVAESEKHGIHVQKLFLLVVTWGPWSLCSLQLCNTRLGGESGLYVLDSLVTLGWEGKSGLSVEDSLVTLGWEGRVVSLYWIVS